MKPFLKWVGSKASLVEHIKPWLPGQYAAYHEAFLGSGALFFALTPLTACLTDANTRLTRTFSALKHDVEAVLVPLRLYAATYAHHGAAFYKHVSATFSDEMDDAELAAVFIFLNKTGFNGVYRVNGSGKYNVPPGTFTTPPVVCDEERLRACAKALGPVTIINCDFRAVEERARPGNVVYFDPPYVPASATGDFTSYTKEKFGPRDQIDLRNLALRLKCKGVHVILSNSDTPFVRELYAGWELKEISRKGGLNSDPTKRGKVGELLIR
jgi:DNA adenine methylase